VLRLLRALGAGGVLGNHDVALLRTARGLRRLKPGDTFGDVLRAEDRAELLGWLRQKPFARAHRRASSPCTPESARCGRILVATLVRPRSVRRELRPRVRDHRALLRRERRAPAEGLAAARARRSNPGSTSGHAPTTRARSCSATGRAWA
jgi:hypothetical protein